MKKLLSLVLALVMVLSLTACGGEKNENPDKSSSEPSSETSASAPEYTLKLSGTVTDGHLVTETEKYFIQRVEELSSGRIKVEHYPNNQLGDPRSMLEATIMGNHDIVECGLPQYAQFTNLLKFFNLPFLWETRDAAYGFMSTEEGQALSEQVEEDVGVHILGFIDNGFFNFTTNRQVSSPADVKGLKLRCQESDVLLQIWTDLGASPLPMSFTEVYTALQQGAIDGQMNGYITNFTSNYFEVQDYIVKLGLLFDVCPLSINADLYNSMPEDLQAVLDQAGAEMQQWCMENARKANQDAADGWVQAGGEITDLTGNLEPWKEATQATYDWFRSSFPEVDLDAILETVAELNARYADVEEVI